MGIEEYNLTGEEDLGYMETNLAPWVKSKLEKGGASIKLPAEYTLSIHEKKGYFALGHNGLIVITKYTPFKLTPTTQPGPTYA